MADIYLSTLVYYKTESDAIEAAETLRVDTALDLKSSKSDEGSPSGVATLDASGTHAVAEVPFSDLAESKDETNITTVINPLRLQQELDILRARLDVLEGA